MNRLDQNASTAAWTSGANDRGNATSIWQKINLPSVGIGLVPPLVMIYLAIAAVLSMIAGTHFTAPHSGNIPGLQTNYWVPPIAAAAGYLLLQCLAKFIGPEQRSWGKIAKHAVQDYVLLGLFILVIYIHFHIKMWIPLLNPHLYDQDYFAVDQALRPVLSGFDAVRDGIAKFLPAADIWYQAGFFAIFVLAFLSHALGHRRFHHHNIMALMLLEMVGVFTYVIAPAVGPFIYEHGRSALATAAQLQMYDVYQHARAGGAPWINANGGSYFAQPLAAMPSLHVGLSLIIAYYAFRARLKVTPITVVVFAWIFIESVAARWHYLIDLPFGLLLAVGVIAVTNRLCRTSDRGAGRGNAEPASLLPLPQGGRDVEALPAHAAERSADAPATVWVLKCHRAGDHAQSLALARALGRPFVVKDLNFRWYELLFALAGRATLAGIDRARSSPLQAPWPELVIMAGRMNETPAKWIRKQSGGRSRIVVIGRNWTPPAELDCLITTRQFRLPLHRNTLVNTFPLHLTTREGLAAAAQHWAPRVSGLPGPYLAVMVGGTSGPYVFSRETARRLGREASALARKLGASLLVSTSARTSRGAARALELAIDVPCHFHRFRPDDNDNPYLGFLALADDIIVTGDSLSMLTEACMTGRPVHIFEFGTGPAAMHGPRGAVPRNRQWWRWSQLMDQGLSRLHYGIAIGLPAWRLNRSRDIRRVQDILVASGRARWMGGADRVEQVRPVAMDDLERAVARVRTLIRIERPVAVEPAPHHVKPGAGAAEEAGQAA
jgi:mitochondrial fission protein ELM1